MQGYFLVRLKGKANPEEVKREVEGWVGVSRVESVRVVSERGELSVFSTPPDLIITTSPGLGLEMAGVLRRQIARHPQIIAAAFLEV